jgi:hypothetical protein
MAKIMECAESLAGQGESLALPRKSASAGLGRAKMANTVDQVVIPGGESVQTFQRLALPSMEM